MAESFRCTYRAISKRGNVPSINVDMVTFKTSTKREDEKLFLSKWIWPIN